MTVEKVNAGPAMQRPQPTTREFRPTDVGAAAEEQMPVGRAPRFDRATGALDTPKAGMLANPVVQQFTSAAGEERTVEQAEVENVDAGAVKIKENKTTAKRSAPRKESKKRGQKKE